MMLETQQVLSSRAEQQDCANPRLQYATAAPISELLKAMCVCAQSAGPPLVFAATTCNTRRDADFLFRLLCRL
jgi:hypothetical protein